MKMFGNNKTGESTAPKGRRILAGIAIALLVIVAAVFIFLKVILKPPEYAPDPTPEVMNSPDVPETEPPEVTVTEEPFDEEFSVQDKSRRIEGLYTFLIIGVDETENRNTDTILLGRLDTNSNELNIINIPRDTLVNVPWKMKKVNSYYMHKREPSAAEVVKGIQELSGIPIDCYAVVNMQAFIAIVEAIGGVDFDIPERLDYYDPDDPLVDIDFQPGLQHLDGLQALQVFRYRGTYESPWSDIKRMAMQQDFLKTVAKKLLTPASLFKIKEYARIFEEYVDTNLSYRQIGWFMTQALKISTEDIHFGSIPTNTGVYDVRIRYIWYLSIQLEEWLEMLNEKLNPLDYEITANQLNILMMDEYGNMSATQGGEYVYDPESFTDGTKDYDRNDQLDPLPGS